MPEIVLDLDGPILDVAARHFAVYAALAAELGFTGLAFAPYWEMKREPRGARRILESTGGGSCYEAFAQRWLELIELDEYLSMDALQPGALATIDRWKAQGHRLVLATMRQDPQALTYQLRSLDVERRFDDVVVCDRREGGEGKAASVAARVGGAPPGSYWIGDTEVDIVAARRRGSRAWALSCGLRGAPYLQSHHPDRLSALLSEVELEREGR